MENPQQLCLLFCYVIALQNESAHSVTATVVSIMVICPLSATFTTFWYRLFLLSTDPHCSVFLSAAMSLLFLPCFDHRILLCASQPPILVQLMVTQCSGFAIHLCSMRFIKHTFFQKQRLTFLK